MRGNSLRPLLSRIGGIYTRPSCLWATLANPNRASAISITLSGVKVTTASGVPSSPKYLTHKYTSDGLGLRFTVTSATPTVRVAPSCLNDLHGTNAVFFLGCVIIFFCFIIGFIPFWGGWGCKVAPLYRGCNLQPASHKAVTEHKYLERFIVQLGL